MRRLIGNFLEVGVEYKLGLLPDDMAHLFPLCHQSAFEGTTERLYR